MVSDLQKRTEFYIEEKKLLDLNSGFHVVIGVSGGADSVCLLLLLKEIAQAHGGTVAAVHVNHNLRGKAAAADEAFVRTICGTLKIPLQVFSENVEGFAKQEHLSLEEAGRLLRYARFAETAAGHPGAKVAVAHHMEDQAETVLFHLLRGAGLSGLSGIRPKTTIQGAEVIRPLLFAERAEIEAWLAERGQAYCSDTTNAETAYARNRIRHRILAEMKEINPQAARHICRTADLAEQTEACLQRQTDALFADCAKEEEGRVQLALPALLQADPLLSDRVLYQAAAKASGTEKDLSRAHIEEVKKLFAAGAGKQICLPDGLRAVRTADLLVFQKAETGSTAGSSAVKPGWQFPVDLKNKAQTVCLLPDGRQFLFEILPLTEQKRSAFIEKNEYTKAFDYAKIMGSLFLGTRQPGEKIALRNGSKSIRRFLIDSKVPKETRDQVLLLKDEREILWIIGHRISERYKITQETQTVLRVTLMEEPACSL